MSAPCLGLGVRDGSWLGLETGVAWVARRSSVPSDQHDRCGRRAGGPVADQTGPTICRAWLVRASCFPGALLVFPCGFPVPGWCALLASRCLAGVRSWVSGALLVLAVGSPGAWLGFGQLVGGSGGGPRVAAWDVGLRWDWLPMRITSPLRTYQMVPSSPRRRVTRRPTASTVPVAFSMSM